MLQGFHLLTLARMELSFKTAFQLAKSEAQGEAGEILFFELYLIKQRSP